MIRGLACLLLFGRVNSMCWSASASIITTAVGGAATVYAAKTGQPKVRLLTLGFFTFMELLQAASYIWLNQCDVSANVWLTRLSYLHISFQIPVVNAFALSFVSEKVRKKWFKPVMVISFIATLLMLTRMFTSILWNVPQEWMCKSWEMLCGANTCSYQGNWHVAWRLPLLGFDPDFRIYTIPVFVLPVLYGSWRWSLFHVIFGPILASFLTTNPNEVPAIWCFFSIAILSAIFFKPLRMWLETPIRSDRG